MPKVRKWAENQDESLYCFFCPGCEGEHVLSSKIHTFNGDVNKPTFSPSVLCTGYIKHKDYEYGRKIKCHSFIENGRIQFLGDCEHALAGQTVELPEI